jgi:RimJ/RimL family protein N-acetyltransferase
VARRTRAEDPTLPTEPVTLADGRLVHVRPIAPSDLEELRRAIENADPETLRMRFLGGRPPQTDEELRHLVDLDHKRREAVVALDDDGHGVGIARYETLSDEHTAEVAIAVDPAWRRVGLATSLLARLLRTALRNGITTIHADYFATNRDVADLVRLAGHEPTTHMSGGVVDEEVSIDRDMLRRASDPP